MFSTNREKGGVFTGRRQILHHIQISALPIGVIRIAAGQRLAVVVADGAGGGVGQLGAENHDIGSIPTLLMAVDATL